MKLKSRENEKDIGLISYKHKIKKPLALIPEAFHEVSSVLKFKAYGR